MPFLNESQGEAMNIVKNGHNLLITGLVGVGKTFTMRKIAEELQVSNNVQLTASTGMARLQYVNAKTLHHWSGYGDGHLSKNTLLHEICTNPGYEDVRQRILSTDVLMIDEIGLISARMFEMVELICRTVRNTDEYFGGIQVIAAGSYVQLPPVPSATDPGLFTFTSPVFSIVFPHRINLTEVIRQQEKDLVVGINELCEGFPSQQTHALMRQLKRPLHNSGDAVYIFGTNFDVNFFNHLKLEKLNGQNKLFEAVNEGDRKCLRACTAPHNLVLKENCKVIVIRNLSNGLVNGLTGIVKNLQQDSVVIEIEEDPNLGHVFGKLQYKIDKYTFVIRNGLNQIVGVRKQLPLKLGYAITVHKAQGRSIPKVVIDAYNFWRPGQLGVAVGRSICKEGLQIQNYSETVASLQHPPSVHKFYKEKSLPLKQDLSCCRKRIADTNINDCGNRPDSDNDDTEEFMVEMGDEEDRECMLAVNVSLPWPVPDIVAKLKYQGESQIHNERNTIIEAVSTTWNFRNYLCQTFEHLQELLEIYKVPPKGKKCNWCVMCNQLHNYFSSTIYLQRAKKAMGVKQLSANTNAICTRAYFVILEEILEIEKSKKFELLLPKETPVVSVEEVNSLKESEKSVLRYVSGACICYVDKKIKQATSRQFMGKMYTAKLEYTKSKLLHKVRVPRDYLSATTNDPGSLLEVLRRERPSGGLVHVSDDAFHFFKVLYLKVGSVQNYKTIEMSPNDVLQRTVSLVSKDMQVMELWCRLFQTQDHHENTCNCTESALTSPTGNNYEKDLIEYEMQQVMVMDLLDMLLNYFCKVHLSDVLSQLKDQKNKTKGLSLRHTLAAAPISAETVQNLVQYPCGICKEECEEILDTRSIPVEEFSVQCDVCSKWFHYRCAGLTGDENHLQPNSTEPYMCVTCYNPELLPAIQQSMAKGRTRVNKTVKASTSRSQHQSADNSDNPSGTLASEMSQKLSVSRVGRTLKKRKIVDM